jgi:hypothetical protein
VAGNGGAPENSTRVAPCTHVPRLGWTMSTVPDRLVPPGVSGPRLPVLDEAGELVQFIDHGDGNVAGAVLGQAGPGGGSPGAVSDDMAEHLRVESMICVVRAQPRGGRSWPGHRGTAACTCAPPQIPALTWGDAGRTATAPSTVHIPDAMRERASIPSYLRNQP